MLAHLFKATVVSIFAFCLFGCATYNRIANYPTPSKDVQIKVEPKAMSSMSLPIGAYHDKERFILITGHQKGMGAVPFFGLIGVLVVDGANKSSAEKKFGSDAKSTSTNLAEITQTLVDEKMASGLATAWKSTDINCKIVFSPYALFTVQPSGKARLYAMLRAEVPDEKGGDAKWSVRYFARAPGEYLIEGEDGWMKGSRFADGMKEALSRTIQVCIDDSHGLLTGTRTITAKGPIPCIANDKIEWRFIAVKETENALVARFCGGDVLVMAGTHVLDKADFEIKDAKFDDPRK